MKKFIIFINLFISLLYHSNSQELRWRTFTDGPNNQSGRFDDVSFVNANTGWIVDGSGQIMKTTNGGFNWQLQTVLSGRYCRAVGFADSLYGWVGLLRYTPQMPNEVLYRTTNGGVNWTLVQNIPEPLYNGICGIWVVSRDIVYASGSITTPALFYKTFNGGTTWNKQLMSQYAGFLIDCYFKDANTGFVAGGSDSNISLCRPVVLYTTNAGNNWSVVFTGSRTNEWCWKMSFISSDIGFISVERFSGPSIFLKTTNGGLNWTEHQFLQNDYDEEGIGFVNENTGWIGGWGGPTYTTTNGGLNWNLAGFGMRINRFRFLSDTLAFAVGQYVYKYSRESSIGISSQSIQEPKNFKLDQNYPNPFNPSTTIKYNLFKPSRVRLVIYDLTGKEIKTLLNDFQVMGAYSVIWNGLSNDGKESASGVYVYALETTLFNETKKMVLIK